eukprot:7252334-Prymnesium_polylepis.1
MLSARRHRDGAFDVGKLSTARAFALATAERLTACSVKVWRAFQPWMAARARRSSAAPPSRAPVCRPCAVRAWPE